MRRLTKFSRAVALAALFSSSLSFADVAADVQHLQERWAEVNYQLNGKAKESAFEALNVEADAIVKANPSSPEALIWSGIIKSTYAGAKGGLGALSLAKASKAELEKAMAIDAKALEGSAYTSLGALYFNVPGWPVGFGDDEKAEELLKQSVALNPAGIDGNYFYGNFLVKEKRYAEARSYFEKALQAPPRPGRALADSGRQQEITQALASIANKK
jgi:tetratricopeptide (TPR) repeat protein